MTKILQKKFYKVDKNIILEKVIFTFDLYKKNEKGKMELINKQGIIVSPQKADLLLKEENLFVVDSEVDNYKIFQEKLLSKTVLPENFLGIYKNMSNTINTIFKNPNSRANIEKVKEAVTEVVDIVLDKNFVVTNFIESLSHDFYTQTHSLNVVVYSICLGRNLDMKKEALEKLGICALIHDIGKAKIDNSILEKRDALSDEEYEIVKKHVQYGLEIAKKIGINDSEILKGLRDHHEKLDGSGYPNGLKADCISLFARIIAICDIFDALTTKKSYKEAISTYETLLLMKKQMSEQLDTRLLNRLILSLRGE